MSKIAKRLGLQVLDTHMGLFDFSVRCVIGDPDKAKEYVAHIFKEKYDEVADGHRGYEARGITYFKTGYVPIVWLPKYPETPREYATLSHEVIHAIYHLFEWAAVPMSRDTEETFAHSVAHVLNNVLDKMELSQRLNQAKSQQRGKKNANRGA